MVVGVRALVLFDLLLGGLPHRLVEVVRVAKLAVLRRLVGCPPAVVRWLARCVSREDSATSTRRCSAHWCRATVAWPGLCVFCGSIAIAATALGSGRSSRTSPSSVYLQRFAKVATRNPGSGRSFPLVCKSDDQGRLFACMQQ